MKEILKGIIELLEDDYGHIYTDCGNDFEKDSYCNRCSCYNECLANEKKMDKFKKLKEQIDTIKDTK